MNKEEKREYMRQWRAKNPDKVAGYKIKYADANKARAKKRAQTPEAKAKRAAWRAKNRDKLAAKWREYAAANREKVHASTKQWKDKNRPAMARYAIKRYITNLPTKLSCVLRSRLCNAIKNDQKAGSAVRDLGCTIDELKAHIEAQFIDGMTWDNWGHTGDVWHLDHIIPLSSFNLTDRDQFLAACHYTNLQPLWAKENLQKGARC